MTLTIHHGDNVDILLTLAPRSVQTIVTSPPYFGLRDYGITPTAWPAVEFIPMPGLPAVTVPAQTVCLGLEADPLAYTAHLVHVFRLARPALADDGTAWLNLGDCYAGSWGNYGGQNRGNGTQRAIVKGSQIDNKAHKGTEHMRPPMTNKIEGIKPKDLMLIPARVALALQADGWYVRNQAIWWKPNAMPESVTDRLTNDYEPLYLLAKSPRYYFDQAAIAVPAIATTNRGGNKKAQHLVESPGAYGDGFKERWQPKETRNKRCVWEIATEALHDEHYAPMPEALVEPCILAGSKPGDTVLDMFFGSGTVGRVALKYGRHCIGIDKNDSYISMSERRTDGVQVHMDSIV